MDNLQVMRQAYRDAANRIRQQIMESICMPINFGPSLSTLSFWEPTVPYDPPLAKPFEKVEPADKIIRAGDQVRCIDNSSEPYSRLMANGDVFTISEVRGQFVDIVGRPDLSGTFASRFEKVQPPEPVVEISLSDVAERPAPQFAEGDKVHCICGQWSGGNGLTVGKVYIISYADESHYVKVEGDHRYYHAGRFQLAAPKKVSEAAERYNFKVQTNLGVLDLDNPDPSLITIEEIAASLSKQCRFSGRCSRHYSVAEHCLLVLKYMEQGATVGPQARKSALLHDAAETWLGDLPTPVKAICPEYKRIEDRLQTIIFEKFGVNGSSNPVIKQADNVLKLAELKHFWPDNADKWNREYPRVAHWRAPIRHYTARKAEQLFLAAFVAS